MALLRDRIRPALYDFFGGRMEMHFAEYRRKALAHAQGRVLELKQSLPLVTGRALARKTETAS
jgi:hypothetical protein